MKYDFNIIIKRTNRKKTVSFRIKNQEVIISVPKFLSDNEIYNLVEIKIKWIKNKLALEKLNNVSIKRILFSLAISLINFKVLSL